MCCTIWSCSWSGDGAGVLQAAVKQLRFNVLQVLDQLGDLAPSVLLVGAALLLVERGKPKSRNSCVALKKSGLIALRQGYL